MINFMKKMKRLVVPKMLLLQHVIQSANVISVLWQEERKSEMFCTFIDKSLKFRNQSI